MKPEIECTDTKVVYRNRWISVREDAIRRADGSPGIYGVVERPDFAIIAAVQDGDLHLVEQYRYPMQGRFWELPQGTWDKAELDPGALAATELREETGLVARSIVHAGCLHLAPGLCTQRFDVFLATDLQQGEAHREPEEQGLIAKAFKLTVVEQMIIDGTLVDGPTIAALGLLRLKGRL